MSCDRVQALLGLGAELDRAEQLLLRRHLRDCAVCRAAAVQEERVRAYLSGLPDLPVPPGLQARLLAIPEAAAAAGSLGALPGAGRVSLLVAAALLGSLGLWLGLRHRAPAPGDHLPPYLSPASGTPRFDASGLAHASPPPPATGRPASAEEPVAASRPPMLHPDRPRATLSSRPRAAAEAVGRAPTRAVGLPEAAGMPSASQGLPGASASDHAPQPAEGDEARESGGRDARRETSAPASTPPPPTSAAPVLASPALPTPAPTVCLAFSAEAFLDLAGEGPRPCAGCDGRFDEADEAAAREMGLVLPNAMLSWVDALELEGDENLALTSSGAKAYRDGIRVCGVLPINVDLTIGLPEHGSLALCPGSSRRFQLRAEDDGAVLRWGIGLAQCPQPTMTPPSQEAETPAAPPSEDPGGGGPPPDPPLVLSSGIVSAMP